MSALYLLIHLIGSLLCAALLLVTWFYWARIPTFNPLVQNLMQLTDWLVVPLRRVIPSYKRYDLASILAAWLVCAVQLILFALLLVGGQFTAFLHTIPIDATIMLLQRATMLVFWLTLFYVLMSWINPLAPAMSLFSALLEPMLAPLRRLPVLRNMQGLDLSPMILGLICMLIYVFLGDLNFSGVRSF